jgi:prefoldin subunit 5
MQESFESEEKTISATEIINPTIEDLENDKKQLQKNISSVNRKNKEALFTIINKIDSLKENCETYRENITKTRE